MTKAPGLLLLAGMLLASGWISINAQAQQITTGEVRIGSAHNNRPLANATVRLLKAATDTTPHGRAVTNSRGTYVISAPLTEGAEYYLVVNYSNQRPPPLKFRFSGPVHFAPPIFVPLD